MSAAYSAKGDKEKGLAELQKTLEMGFRDFPALDDSPYFASLRGDARYAALMRKYRK
ncbi:MAG: hypothetical protein WCB53_14380 [Terriglobales bacterium]